MEETHLGIIDDWGVEEARKSVILIIQCNFPNLNP
jgi:hypothetical protein